MENYRCLRLFRRLISDFESASHEQFYHVTLPVWYKGVDVADYTNAEQSVISAIWYYISDNSGFQRKQNNDIIIQPATEHVFEPKLIQIDGKHNALTQLIFRRLFNPTNNIDTSAIDTSSNEIYMFKHQLIPTYDNTRN